MTRQQILKDIARQQWQADIPCGDVALQQLERTDEALAQLGMTRLSAYYVQAYEKARTDFR